MRAPGAPRGLVIFDGDDTLWDVESLYEAARHAILALLRDRDFDPGDWERMQRRLDLQRFEVERFSPDRFPGSCVAAYVELSKHSGRAEDPNTSAEIEAIARAVFSERAPLAPDAETVLRELRSAYSLLLLTQGDKAVQEKRVNDSGLAELFDEVVITGHKDEQVFRSIVSRAGSGVDGWSVGNSLASDIEPAVRCGMRAVLVRSQSWEFEQRSSGVGRQDFSVAATLADVLPILLGMTTRIS